MFRAASVTTHRIFPKLPKAWPSFGRRLSWNANQQNHSKRRKYFESGDFVAAAYLFSITASFSAIVAIEWSKYRVRNAWTKLDQNPLSSPLNAKEIDFNHERKSSLVADESANAWPPLTRLDSIRLFQIIELSEDGICKVQLSEFSMDELPTFDAISYCWTTSPGFKEIICNDQKVSISQSLHNALLQRGKLQHGFQLEQSDYFWADTLCISQQDLTEKNTQVRKIGQIFSCARNVWIYPGDIVKDLPDSVSKTLESALVKEKGRLQYAEEGVAWFELPYFERLWIIQEICNAQRIGIIIDGHIETWDTLIRRAYDLQAICSLYGIADSNITTHLHNIKTINDIRNGFRSGRSKIQMIDLVLGTSHFKTGDPRDRIFALVGLASDTDNDDWELLPDYRVSPEEVYKRFAMWALARKKDMRVLSLESSREFSSTPDLPSWVPNLSTKRRSESSILAVADDERLPDSRLMPYLNGCRPHQRFADGDLRPYCLKRSIKRWLKEDDAEPIISKVTFADDNAILQVRGALIDQISEIGDIAPFTSAEDDASFSELLAWQSYTWDDELADYFCDALATKLDVVAQWLDQNLKLATKPGALHDLLQRDALNSSEETAWRTLMCNRLSNGNWARAHMDGRLKNGYRPTPKHDIVAELSLRYGSTCPEVGLAQPYNGIAHTKEPIRTSTKDELRRCLRAGALAPHSSSTRQVHQSYLTSQNPDHLDNPVSEGAETVSIEHFLQRFLPEETEALMVYALPAITRWFKNRRLCITRAARCGAVPAAAQPGDIVCIFLGATVPYVLRPNADGTYNLIGECYVDGIMNGGAFANIADQPFQLLQHSQWQPGRVFSIR